MWQIYSLTHADFPRLLLAFLGVFDLQSTWAWNRAFLHVLKFTFQAEYAYTPGPGAGDGVS